jgi:hypothetical protein
MDLFSVVWAGPKKTCKLWLELFVTDRVIATSAIDDMHITQIIVYSNFIKIIYERGNRYGIIHPKFLEHGDFLVKSFGVILSTVPKNVLKRVLSSQKLSKCLALKVKVCWVS